MVFKRFFGRLAELGRVEGTRKAMRDSYAKHVREIESGRIPIPAETSTRRAGLYGAFSTRYISLGIDPSQLQQIESLLWSELLPFTRSGT